jgi:hypothetical protein
MRRSLAAACSYHFSELASTILTYNCCRYTSKHATNFIGVHDHGGQCHYLNALLELYFNIPALRAAVFSSANAKCGEKDNETVISRLRNLFEHLENEEDSVCPMPLVEALEKQHIDLTSSFPAIIENIWKYASRSTLEDYIKGRKADKSSFICTK